MKRVLWKAHTFDQLTYGEEGQPTNSAEKPNLHWIGVPENLKEPPIYFMVKPWLPVDFPGQPIQWNLHVQHFDVV